MAQAEDSGARSTPFAAYTKSTKQNEKHLDYDSMPLSASQKQIRILTLVDGWSLTADLTVEALDDAVDAGYVALSYAWGTWLDYSILRCPGGYIRVTNSLRVALRALFDLGHRRLWVDQVCIDQSSDDEKSQQVGMMREIYQRAKVTVAYLGAGSSLSDSAIHILEQLTGPDLMLDPVVIRDRSVEHLCRTWKRLLVVLPYFKRTWVLQEALISPNLVFAFRTRLIPSDTVAEIIRLVMTHGCGYFVSGPHWEYPVLTSRSVPSSIAVLDSWNQLLRSHDAYSRLPIWNALRFGRSFQASDDRDKVWALSGLAKGFELKPDYSKTVVETYIMVAEQLLTSSEVGIRILEEAGRHQTRIDGLPSWVPDWSNQHRAFRRVDADWPAVEAWTPPKDGILKVSAQYQDRLRAVGPINNDKRTVPNRHQTTLNWYHATAAWLQRVSAADARPESEAPPTHEDTDGESTRDWVDDDCRVTLEKICLLDASPTSADIRALRNLMATSDMSNLLAPDWQKLFGDSEITKATFIQNLTDITSRRAVGVTEHGHVALVPDLAAPGDPIVLFRGLFTTHVLRREKRKDVQGGCIPRYTLLGEAFHSETFTLHGRSAIAEAREEMGYEVIALI